MVELCSDRFGKVSMRSSPHHATVHRTVAFESFDSPQTNTIPNKMTTRRVVILFVDRLHSRYFSDKISVVELNSCVVTLFIY